jgi:O-antigen/teichoic acid export membrane protein
VVLGDAASDGQPETGAGVVEMLVSAVLGVVVIVIADALPGVMADDPLLALALVAVLAGCVLSLARSVERHGRRGGITAAFGLALGVGLLIAHRRPFDPSPVLAIVLGAATTALCAVAWAIESGHDPD